MIIFKHLKKDLGIQLGSCIEKHYSKRNNIPTKIYPLKNDPRLCDHNILFRFQDTPPLNKASRVYDTL